MSAEVFDVGIIGGGVIGLSCAWRLAQSGARVALFERGEIGREASWAAAGMLAAQCEAAHHPPSENGTIEYSKRAAMFDLCLQSRAMYADFADELLDATGVDIELSLKGQKRNWHMPGILYVATREDAAIQAFEKQKQDGFNVEKIAPQLSHFTFGDLSQNAATFGLMWLPDEGQVDNRKLVEALHKAALGAGVTIFEGDEITSVGASDMDGGVVNLRTLSAMHQCVKAILCAGAWSGHTIVPMAQSLRPVVPIGGQMLCVRHSLHYIIYSSDVYLVPKSKNRLLIGATVEKADFRKHSRKNATFSGLSQLMHAACDLIPELADAPILETWAGLRPGTSDGLPILGSTPIKNLYVATGHYRNGILLAPITAKLMTDCILNGVEPPREFSIERFQNEEAGA